MPIILSLIATIITIFVFLTGIQSIPDLFGKGEYRALKFLPVFASL